MSKSNILKTILRLSVLTQRAKMKKIYILNKVFVTRYLIHDTASWYEMFALCKVVVKPIAMQIIFITCISNFKSSLGI